MEPEADAVPGPIVRLERSLAPAAVLAIAAFVLGQVHYRVLAARNVDALPLGVSLAEAITAQSYRIALIVLLCAVAGGFWRERAGLPGIGRWPGPRTAALLLGLGGVGAVVTSLAYDVHFRPRAPGLYPGSPAEALALYPMNPLVDEVIGRMGFLTLLSGLTGRVRTSIVLHAFVMTGLATFAHYRLTGWPDATDGLLWIGVACGLLVHTTLGFVYRHHGLVGATLAHAGLQAKLFWLVG